MKILFVGLALLILAAPRGAADSAVALEPVTVQLDWKPDAEFAGILVAEQKGYYRSEGLAVTIQPGDVKMETAAEIAQAPHTIGLAEADELLVDQAQGIEIKAFATMLQTSPFSLLTLEGSGLVTLKDLRGKKIGLHDVHQKAIDVLLNFNGMTRHDVTIVPIGDQLDPLTSRQVDAMQGYLNDEAVELRLEGHPVHVIRMSDNGYICYAEVLFTSASFLASKPKTLAKFVSATAAGWREAVAHPDQTAQMIVSRYMPQSTATDQAASIRAVAPLLNGETHDDRFGFMKRSTWDQSVAMFNKYQLVGHDVSANQLVTYSILQILYPQK